jgi:hypothetical protein
MNLTADNVHDVFMKCLFKDNESKENYVEARGVTMHIGFHPGRLEENREKVISMLDCLPDNFKENKGGGWSFLNACNDKDGVQWADMHQTMDELVCLGLALKALKFQLPREMWGAFPGGMPYFSVSIPETEGVS